MLNSAQSYWLMLFINNYRENDALHDFYCGCFLKVFTEVIYSAITARLLVNPIPYAFGLPNTIINPPPTMKRTITSMKPTKRKAIFLLLSKISDRLTR